MARTPPLARVRTRRKATVNIEAGLGVSVVLIAISSGEENGYRKTKYISAAICGAAELMAELTRYRRHYGLAALPYGGETTPLLLPIGGTHRTMTRDAVHLIIKQVFGNAIGLWSRRAKRTSAHQSDCAKPLPIGCGTRLALA
ncbi:hypothetical protein SAMN05414139_09778 [Burkholderia sp. D7]|nr:hypothetical protein SAMN05414139_09778 [Burkholderia sp. D7]